MIANGKVFAVLLIVFVGGLGKKKNCEPIRDEIKAIKHCINETEPDDACFRRCIQEKRGVREDGILVEAKLKEAALKNWKNKEFGNKMYEVGKECIDKVAEYDDDCENALEFTRCLTGNEEVKKILVNNVCKDPLARFIIPPPRQE